MEKLLVTLALRALIGPAHLSRPQLRYSAVARGFATFCLTFVIVLTLTVALRRLHLPPGQGKPFAAVVIAFAALTVPLAIEFFGVKHTYDGAGITYRSPWSGQRRIAWAEVARVEWRPTLKWLDIVPADGSLRLHLHPMIGGLKPFAKVALQQVPSRAWIDQPEAYIALPLLAAGQHASLMMDARKPSELAIELGVLPLA